MAVEMQRQTCVWHRLFRVKCDKTENHSLPVAPEERQTTSLPRQRFARFAVFGFSSGLQHQGAAGLANSSLQRSLLMQRNSVSVTSVSGSWSCRCVNTRAALSDVRDN